jgi:subfamily B ATP-binding cassette protein MsbA
VESVEAALFARRVRSLLGPAVTAMVALGTAAVLWFGARQVLEGAMTAGELVVFMAYLGRLFRPIQGLARASTNIAQAAVGLERVKAVLDADDRLPRSPLARKLERVQGHVAFRGVTFGYDPSRPVLKDISFAIAPGQMVGLVGRSGSGKSTLVSLIPRFYDPDAGLVTLDGTDIREFTIRSLRRRIGFVLQDTQLFHAPVWQNIAYGSPDATRQQIIQAAQLAQAHEFIEALPDGYDTVLGHGGVTLSGGQRQRLGIARAMVRDAAILILDEPSSGLDAEAERLVFEGLARLLANRTTFVIAHRLATVRRADVILVLDDGRLVQQGTHQELLAQDGLYAELVRMQHGDGGSARDDAQPRL